MRGTIRGTINWGCPIIFPLWLDKWTHTSTRATILIRLRDSVVFDNVNKLLGRGASLYWAVWWYRQVEAFIQGSQAGFISPYLPRPSFRAKAAKLPLYEVAKCLLYLQKESWLKFEICHLLMLWEMKMSLILPVLFFIGGRYFWPPQFS